MPRRARSIVGGYVYHILNRANARSTIFKKPADYEAFERVLAEAQERVPLRMLAYCIMPNHWHMVVWPRQGQHSQVSEFFRWLTLTHTQR
jgi:putative transposase